MYAPSDTSWPKFKIDWDIVLGTPQSVSDAETVRERGPTPEIPPESFDRNQRSVRARGPTPEVAPKIPNPNQRQVRVRGPNLEITGPRSPDHNRRSGRARGQTPEILSPRSPDQCRRPVRARGPTPEQVLGPRSPDQSRRARARGLTPEVVARVSPDRRRRQVRARGPTPEVVRPLSAERRRRLARARGPTPERVPRRSPRRSRSHVRKSKAQKKADSRTILVYNLPFDVDRKDLTNLFKDYGEIRCVTVPLDSDYDFMGFAYVQFKHRKSSYDAIMGRNYRMYRSLVLRVESKKSYFNKIARRRAQGRPYFDVTAGRRRYDANN